MSYVLTKKGEQRIREFIKKCEEKRELILENGIDTANVEIVNEGDINIDLFFNNSPSKGENFQHAYPVTDHFAQDLVLEYEVISLIQKKKSMQIQFSMLLKNSLMKKNVRFHGSRVMGTVKQRDRSYSKDFVSSYKRRMIDEKESRNVPFYFL